MGEYYGVMNDVGHRLARSVLRWKSGGEPPRSKEVLYTFAWGVGEYGEGERGDG
jgi:hypothetical protein